MPTDPWLWDSSPVPRLRPAIPITVSRYNASEEGDAAFEVLDNLECIEIHQSIGIDPGRARFRYRFTGLDEDAPQSIEEALSDTITLAKTIAVNDELVVQATRPDGTMEFVFWGLAVTFGMGLGRNVENVEITCVGVAKGAWDETLGGLEIRDSSNIATGKDYQSDIPAQFNPNGEPNATPTTSMVNADSTGMTDMKYNTFMDPLLIQSPDVRAKWTLPMVVRRLVFPNIGSTVMTSPTGDVFDSIFVSREPIEGTAFDPDNPATFTVKPIIVSDKPITGRDWPSTMNDFISDKGFGMSWDIGASDADSSRPACKLAVFVLQGGTLKDVYLQTRGSTFDPELSNIGEASVMRDVNQVVNQWEVLGALKRKEITIVLAPGFPMAAADATTLAKYDSTSDVFAGNSDAYRLFIFDECGEGRYLPGGSTLITGATSLDAVLGAPDGAGNPTHATRRRRPISTLISTDANQKHHRFTVAVSTNYAGAVPGVWDRTGNWQTVDGQVELLKDRLGIRVTATNPNAWRVGKCQDTGAPYPMGVCKLVESLCTAGGDAINPTVYLRLTCCIDDDNAVSATAQQTDSSIMPQIIQRQIDARDRYKHTTVCESSEFNDGGPDVIVRDDTADCMSEAIAARVASECGILHGEITIPRFTRYYQIGDRIQQINGRNLGLRTDNGASANTNAAVYPVVVGIRHILEGGQKTILSISDQDGHRRAIERKIKRD